MPSLQVRNLPENVYTQLQQKAKASHRSLAQEAVITLAKGLHTSPSNKNRRQKLLKSIAEAKPTNEKVMLIDPVTLLREDRQR